MESHGLEFSGIAVDLWSEKLVNADDGGTSYLAAVRKNLEFAKDLGITIIRVDTVEPPEFLDTAEKSLAMDRVVQTWRKVCRIGADMGMKVSWEFEPGFVFNKPCEIVALVDAVGEKNFGVLFDTCHAHTCAVVGRDRRAAPRRCRRAASWSCRRGSREDHAIHLIDCDGSLNEHNTSTHNPFGDGNFDFPPVMKELAAHRGAARLVDDRPVLLAATPGPPPRSASRRWTS